GPEFAAVIMMIRSIAASTPVTEIFTGDQVNVQLPVPIDVVIALGAGAVIAIVSACASPVGLPGLAKSTDTCRTSVVLRSVNEIVSAPPIAAKLTRSTALTSKATAPTSRVKRN